MTILLALFLVLAIIFLLTRMPYVALALFLLSLVPLILIGLSGADGGRLTFSLFGGAAVVGVALLLVRRWRSRFFDRLHNPDRDEDEF